MISLWRFKLVLKIGNTKLPRQQNLWVVSGAPISSRGQLETLNRKGLTTSNDFSHPNAVSIKSETIATGSSFEVIFPEHSVSVVTVEVQR